MRRSQRAVGGTHHAPERVITKSFGWFDDLLYFA